MKTLVRITLLMGAIACALMVFHVLFPPASLVLNLSCDGQPQGTSIISSSWGSSMNMTEISGTHQYQLKVRVLSGGNNHARLSYNFTSTFGGKPQSSEGTLSVSNEANQKPMQLGKHVTLLAYVNPNL